MGNSGWVLHPDGSKVFVTDKETYMEQHPETRSPSEAAERAVKIDTTYHELQKEADELWKRKQKKVEAAQVAKGDSFSHYCVGGKVAANCNECRGSFAGATCKKCNGSKVVFETCGECAKVEDGAAL